MTDLQKRFAEEYVVDYHITDAGKRAGIQGDNIKVTAWKMLQLPEVQAYVEQLQDEAANRASITKDMWVAEWAKLGFSNIQNYMDDSLNPKLLSEVKDPQAIKSVKKTTSKSEDGFEKETVEFVLHDKVAGLLNLGKHFGWYDEDNKQKIQPEAKAPEIKIYNSGPDLSSTEKIDV
jgi:phage terminase small subunit